MDDEEDDDDDEDEDSEDEEDHKARLAAFYNVSHPPSSFIHAFFPLRLVEHVTELQIIVSRA